MDIVVFDQQGNRHDLSGEAGNVLMAIIRDAGLPIAAQCGGCCSCATCHVYVGDAWRDLLPPRSEEEAALLELAVELRPSSRLSCQIQMSEALDGIEVTLAAGTEW